MSNKGQSFSISTGNTPRSYLGSLPPLDAHKRELEVMEHPEDDYIPANMSKLSVADFDREIFENEILEGSDSESDEENIEYQRNLTLQTQALLLKTFDQFYEQESESMLNILAQSREEIKDSMLDLVEEQSEFKKELNKVTDGRYSASRKKENSIPLSVYIRRKRGETTKSSSNLTLNSQLEEIQIPLKKPIDNVTADQVAVDKYIKKRERKRVAESNRIRRDGVELTTQIDRILSAVQGTEDIKEKERERQMEKIQQKLKSAKSAKTNSEQDVVNEILENYNDSKLAFEREKQQQEKRFQRIRSSKIGSGKMENRIKLQEEIPEVDV